MRNSSAGSTGAPAILTVCGDNAHLIDLPSTHDVISAIHVDGHSCNRACRRGCQEGGHRAHVVDFGQAAEWCLALLLKEHRVEVLESGSRSSVDRAGRDGIDADALGAEF